MAVDAPGSRAHDDDVAYVQRLTKLGVRPEGLRFTVRDLRVVAATADGVTVEATVTTSAFRQVRADGTTFESLPAKTVHRVQLTLVRTGGDWRISAVV
ncbi:MAG TPA: hypothetical protein VE781_02915 [Kineosporiaceae bacterium]|nr:hypothetical protein [Kineosporiaceae bacterium]